MSVSLTDRQVVGRPSEVRKLITRIRPKNRSGHVTEVAAEQVRIAGRTQMIIAACEAGGQTGCSHRDWLFRTAARTIWGQYEEVWQPQGRAFHLTSASLHLFEVAGPGATDRAEVFALHCEPGHLGATLADECKRGPHVHMKPAGEPLSHAHIPVTIGSTEQVVSSFSEFDRVFSRAIEVVRHEIIARFGD